MKPDWKDAPEWANWCVMDSDGFWYWFENKPVLGAYGIILSKTHGNVDLINMNRMKMWRDTLEERPKLSPQIS